MANDFSQDANCKAVWNFESGGVPFLADSKGGNTLNNQGVDEDTEDYKQGSCSSAYIRANTDRFYVVNSALDSSFPLKSGESNKTFSIAVWVKFTGTITDRQVIGGFLDTYTFRLMLDDSKITLDLGDSGSGWTHEAQHGTALVTGRWYHVGVTYDASDDEVRIRVWDDTAQEIVGIDAVSTEGDIYIGDGLFSIGFLTYSPEANFDELVVFNDVISVAEIDQIRAGTFGGGVIKELSGTIAAQSGLSGSLWVDRKLAGVIAAQSGMTGALQVDRELAGVIAAHSGLSGSLTIEGIIELAGVIAAQSGMSGSLRVDRKLAGVIAAQSGMSGSLTVERQPVAGGTFASLTRDFWWLD